MDSSRLQTSATGRRSFQAASATQVLHRKIFAPAKSPSNGRVAHDNLLHRKLEHGGNLPAILVEPLPGSFDDHPVLLVYVGNAGLRLEKGMLLP